MRDTQDAAPSDPHHLNYRSQLMTRGFGLIEDDVHALREAIAGAAAANTILTTDGVQACAALQ
jgi:hypothetical protein